MDSCWSKTARPQCSALFRSPQLHYCPKKTCFHNKDLLIYNCTQPKLLSLHLFPQFLQVLALAMHNQLMLVIILTSPLPQRVVKSVDPPCQLSFNGGFVSQALKLMRWQLSVDKGQDPWNISDVELLENFPILITEINFREVSRIRMYLVDQSKCVWTIFTVLALLISKKEEQFWMLTHKFTNRCSFNYLDTLFTALIRLFCRLWCYLNINQ